MIDFIIYLTLISMCFAIGYHFGVKSRDADILFMEKIERENKHWGSK